MNTPGPSHDELQQWLRRLHADSAANPEMDAHSRELLQEVLADIERLLHHRGSLPDAATGPRAAPRRLSELAVQFEARHPLLAASARQFVDLLGRAGL